LKAGFAPVTTTIDVGAGQQQPLSVELEKPPTVEETVTVSATRTDGRVADQPMRVEVLDREEIEEKQLMTPGDIVMMLNEMGGPRGILSGGRATAALLGQSCRALVVRNRRRHMGAAAGRDDGRSRTLRDEHAVH